MSPFSAETEHPVHIQPGVPQLNDRVAGVPGHVGAGGERFPAPGLPHPGRLDVPRQEEHAAVERASEAAGAVPFLGTVRGQFRNAGSGREACRDLGRAAREGGEELCRADRICVQSNKMHLCFS